MVNERVHKGIGEEVCSSTQGWNGSRTRPNSKCIDEVRGIMNDYSDVKLYNWMWKNEYVPRRWRNGVVVNLCRNVKRLTQGTIEG